MREHETKLVFHSPLGALMIQFVHEKQPCGSSTGFNLIPPRPRLSD